MTARLLEIRGARKSFGAIQALAGVDLYVNHGEVVALLGDNGAGKSTLIKAINGVHHLDHGEIWIEGEHMTIRSAADSRHHGIETVYQDLAVFDNLDAKANFFVGRELTSPRALGRIGFLRGRAMAKQWQQHIRDLEVNIPNPEQPIGVMSGGQRQAIAVARAVAFATRLVILDEPTAALGVRESKQVLDLIKRLPARGISVLLISHNMEHVMEVADRAVVLRRGQNVGTATPSRANHERLVSMIVGASASQETGSASAEQTEEKELP